MHNIDPSLQRATIDLLQASLFARERFEFSDDSDAPFEAWLQQYSEWIGLTTMQGLSLVERLKNCLTQLQSVHNEPEILSHSNTAEKEELRNALHSAIKSLQAREKFQEAVAIHARRGIYDLTYGLTHEINNPLANIAARAQQLISRTENEADKRSLATIVDQAMRAHEMLADTMQVVKPSELARETFSICDLIQRAMEHLRKLRESQAIEFQTHFPTTPLYVSTDRVRLEEVIVSLLKNSLEACRPSDRIDVLVESVDPKDPDFGPGEGNAPRVRVAIHDTGHGLAPESAERAFHLYYSGREHGRGLGISLAKAKQLIEAHGGKIWIRSSPNLGTTLEIRLSQSPPPTATRKRIRL